LFPLTLSGHDPILFATLATKHLSQLRSS
jgi:hypothetical protein